MSDEIMEWGTLDVQTNIVTSCPDEWTARQLLAITPRDCYQVVRRVCSGSVVSRWEVCA